jgi:threonine dehydratase
MRVVLAPRAAHAFDTPTPLPDRAAIERARGLVARFPEARLREVALVRARELDLRADTGGATRVWLALESLQVTGSFKVRGAVFALAAIKEAAVRAGDANPRVIAASAGNHGAGVAYAARMLGVRASIVVPTSTPRAKRDRIVACGAEVVFGPTAHYDDAEAAAIAMAAKEQVRFLSAYDDEDVLLGNGASLGFEITRALGRPADAILTPFGGGGLACGLACASSVDAAEALTSRSRRRVWGAQSEACPAMAKSLELGSAVEKMTADSTLADGLEGGIPVRAFQRARGAVAGVVVVIERAIAEAVAFAVKELGLVIEGSAACALAPVLAGLPEPMRLPGGGDLVVVLSGRNIDREVLAGTLDPRPA